jgi:hypothetical protein
MAAFDQRTRAEPGHRAKTEAEVEVMFAEWHATKKAEREAQDAARKEHKAQYDEGRESARLRLLEVEAHLFIATHDGDQLVSHVRAPAMDASRRARAMAEEESRIERPTALVPTLRGVVGDPETVVDRDGWLPNERGEPSLTGFSLRHRREVEQLREAVAVLPATLRETKDCCPISTRNSG